MSTLDGTEPTPIRPHHPITLESRLTSIELQQMAMASSMLRSMSATEKYIADTEPRLHWCIGECYALRTALWLLSALNVFLLSALSVLLILYVRAFWT